MWHVTFLQPLCLLFVLISLAIHSPHHLPVLLTIMYSSPGNRSDWHVLSFYRVCSGKAEEPLIKIKFFITTDCFFCLFVCFPDVPRNFSVNLATKTSVLLTWEFPESSNPYRFTVCPSTGGHLYHDTTLCYSVYWVFLIKISQKTISLCFVHAEKVIDRLCTSQIVSC